MTLGIQYRVRLPHGQEYGPATLETVCQWAREGRVTVDSLLVPTDGGAVRSVLSEPALASLLQPRRVVVPAQPVPDDSMATIIPYRNPPALFAYYLAVFSLIPIIGFFLAVPAVILGIVGLRRLGSDPHLKGVAHAWIGIIGGGVLGIVWGAVLALIIVAAATA